MKPSMVIEGASISEQEDLYWTKTLSTPNRGKMILWLSYDSDGNGFFIPTFDLAPES